MKEEIEAIILDKNLNYTDKLIKIWIIIKGQTEFPKLSIALDIPEILLNNWKFESEFKLRSPEPKESEIKKYIRIFRDHHKAFFGRPIDFKKKEVGQMINIMKVVDLPVYEQIFKMIGLVQKRIKNNIPVSGNWKFIMDNFVPGIFYNKINFILNEYERVKGKINKKNWSDTGTVLFKNLKEGTDGKAGM